MITHLLLNKKKILLILHSIFLGFGLLTCHFKQMQALSPPSVEANVVSYMIVDTPPPTATILSQGTPSATIPPPQTATLSLSSTVITRPEFEKLLEFITNFIQDGGNLDDLEHLLRDWHYISDRFGGVKIKILKDREQKLVIIHCFQDANLGRQFPGRLMILHISPDGVQDIYDSTLIGAGFVHDNIAFEDADADQNQDIAFIIRDCGAHTCYGYFHLLEWNGDTLVNLMGRHLAMLSPTILIEPGQITAVSGYVDSVGAGKQRAYTEIWQWTGQVFTQTYKTIGPPVIRMHFIDDGDEAFKQGDLEEAISLYNLAITDQDLSTRLHIIASQETGAEISKAYAHFKLMIVFAYQNQIDQVQEHFSALSTSITSDEEAQNWFIGLAQNFLEEYLATNNVKSACSRPINWYTGYKYFDTGYANGTKERVLNICSLPLHIK